MENKNFEKIITEADETSLAERANSHAETAEGMEMKGEELMKKAIQSVAGEAAAPEPVSGLIDDPLTDYAAREPEEVKRKIEALLQIAADSGIAKATEEARRSSPFILDAFHDALAAKVYPYLKGKGLLK
jgi:hypothetical protein